MLLQLWPTIVSPGDGTLDEQSDAILSRAVAVTDEDVLAVEGVGGTMASGLPLFLVAFQDDGTATVSHILAAAVEVGTVYRLAAPHGYSIVRLGTTTTVVPRHKEVVVAIVLEDERCLNGIRACIP